MVLLFPPILDDKQAAMGIPGGLYRFVTINHGRSRST